MPDASSKSSRPLLWTLVGILPTVALGGPALYFTLQERTPSLRIEITSEANVFDLHKSLDELDIIFQGKNIRKANQNLRIVTLTIRNAGRGTILQNHFDTTDPWGLRVTNAQLVDAPRVVDSNSDYLREKLQPTVPKPDVVEFHKVIFEPGKFISLELLLLHEAGITPEFLPLGKVAGIDELTVTRRPPEHAASTFWGTVLDGSTWVHLSRLGLYAIALIAPIFLGAGVSRLKLARRWRRLSAERSGTNRRVEEHCQTLFNDFTPIDKQFAMGLLSSTAGNTEVLAEIKDVILSADTPLKVSNAKQFLKKLSEGAIGPMFRIQVSIPRALFEQAEDGSCAVTKRAQRVVPALVDFLASNPIPAELTPDDSRHPYSHLPEHLYRLYMAERRGRGIDWQSIDYNTRYVEEEH